MERKKNIMTILFLFIFFTGINASENLTVYKSYITDNMERWESVMIEMENRDSLSIQDKLNLINFEYGYIAWCIANDMENEAEKWLEYADQNITSLGETRCCISMIKAYKAAFYGFKIGLNPLMAPVYGPKSMENVKLSLKEDEKNWFGLVQNANVVYYMPKIFGGSKSKAIDLYIEALNQMEKHPKLILNNWNYLNLIITIGNAYHQTGNEELANKYYQKALQVEPEFKWAKQHLKNTNK